MSMSDGRAFKGLSTQKIEIYAPDKKLFFSQNIF